MKKNKKGDRYVVGKEKGKPFSVVDTSTSDVVCYIPDGKTKVVQREDECADCTEKNKSTAQDICNFLNEAHIYKNTPKRNNCGNIIK